MVLFRNSKELQLGTCGLKVNNAQVQRNKGEKCSFMDLGGALVNEEFIGGNWNFKV